MPCGAYIFWLGTKIPGELTNNLRNKLFDQSCVLITLCHLRLEGWHEQLLTAIV